MLLTIPGLLTDEEITRIRILAAEAEHEFVDGRTTTGRQSRAVKNNEQLASASEGRKQIDAIVQQAFKRSYRFQVATLPKDAGVALVSRYKAGMTYGDHVDEWRMFGRMRSDLSVTLFIADPADYDGGELVISIPGGEQTVKLAAGSAIVYPSTTLHRVDPVTRGIRLVVVTWVQSFVRDPQQREVLQDLQHLRMRLVDADPSSADARVVSKTFNNLMRMWAEMG